MRSTKAALSTDVPSQTFGRTGSFRSDSVRSIKSGRLVENLEGMPARFLHYPPDMFDEAPVDCLLKQI